MSFMDRISSDHCILDDYIEEYDGNQIVFLGAGYGAKSIANYFLERKIDDFRVCVNEQYWKPNAVFMDQYPIENAREIFEEETDEIYDVVIAYVEDRYDLGREYSLKYPKKVRKVIQVDVIPHFWQKCFISYVDREYYQEHETELEWLYNELNDDDSKRALISFVEQRISGDYSYCEGVLSNPEFEYFEPEIIKKNNDESYTLVDCGAYDGKETKYFFNTFEGGERFSVVIEPDHDNIELIKNTLDGDMDRIDLIEAVLSDEYGEVGFESGNGLGSGISDGGGIPVL